MGDGDGMNDRQAQPRTVGSSTLGTPGEALEDNTPVVVADTGTRVGDPETQPPAFDARAEGDPAAGIGVAASVVGERNQRLSDALRVEDGVHVCNCLHDEITIAEQSDLIERVGRQCCDVDGFGMQEGRLSD